MKKSEFLREIASKSSLGVTIAQAEEVLAIAGETFMEDLKKNKKSKFSNLFIAEVKQRNERQGVNPKTGEKITIAAREVVKVSPTSVVKNIV